MTNIRFDFRKLFIFDIANNHQGDVDHGIGIIKGIAEVVKKHKVKAAIKFQFRDLDSFIHPEHRRSKENKHIQRFLSTRLRREDFEAMLAEIRRQGMVSACTPFDEKSVDEITALDIDIIKVASCSALDWSLLDKISVSTKPVIVSTAGINLSNIEKLAGFLEKKGVDFALMHCAAVYPTPFNKLRLNQIQVLRDHFPRLTIGFSTHEEPDNYSAIKIAYAKGSEFFERHVGLQSTKYKLNEYSSTPKQIDKWLAAYELAVGSCGGENRSPALPEEVESLRSLSRGVFAGKEIKKNQKIKRSDVFFAMPLLDKQLMSSEWSEHLIADKNYKPGEKFNRSLINLPVPASQLVSQVLQQARGILSNARISIGADSPVEISHHYGLDRFREFGCVIVNYINRAYSKKLVIMLPRQKHPYHHHKVKEEVFQLLYGDMTVEIDGVKTKLVLGETILVKPGQWHKFQTLDGAIFEEVATAHMNDDSFYEDERISRIPRQNRKTMVPTL